MSLGKYLKTFVESHGVQKTCQFLSEGLAAKKIRPEQFSLRGLAEAFVGGGNLEKLSGKARQFLEASDAVDASHFSAITGQLLIDRVKEKYKEAVSVADQLCSVEPITNGNLGTQREPWLSDVAETPEKLQPGMPYPASHFDPHYIDFPAPEKFGRLCLVTMEMLFSDLTRQALQSADSVGRRIGLARKKRILNVVLGLTNNHSWNGTSYNTYQTASPWINDKSGVQVRDWDNINTIEQLFNDMLDPTTGEVIDVEPTAIFCMPSNKYNIRRALAATVTKSGPFATSGVDASKQIEAPNPLDTNYPVLTDKHAYKLLTASGVTASNAKEYVFLGDFKRAFVYREVFPLQTFQAPPLNPLDWNQDISVAVKGREFGVAGVRDPRFVVRSYNS